MTQRQTRTMAGPAGPLAVDVYNGPANDGAIVLVHPINTAASVWAPVAEALDRPVVAIDLRGHGRSTMEGPFGIEGSWLEDLMTVLDSLDLGSVHLAGGSLGGAVSLAAAALHQDRVRSVSVFGSTLGVGLTNEAIEQMVADLEAKGPVAYFAELGPLVVGAAYRNESVLGGLAAAVGARDTAVIGEILRAAFSADIRHIAGDVKVPVLVAVGTEDPTTPPAMAEEIVAVTGGTAMALPGVGHLPMLEVPELVAALIARHIELTV